MLQAHLRTGPNTLGQAACSFSSKLWYQVQGVTAPPAKNLNSKAAQPAQTRRPHLRVRGVVGALGLAQSPPINGEATRPSSTPASYKTNAGGVAEEGHAPGDVKAWSDEIQAAHIAGRDARDMCVAKEALYVTTRNWGACFHEDLAPGCNYTTVPGM